MSADDTDGKVVPLKPKPKPKRRTGNTTFEGEHDIGNATRFVAMHGARVRWATDRLGWFVWSQAEGRWTPDDMLKRMTFAKGVARQVLNLAATRQGDQALWRHAKYSASKRGLDAMISTARNEVNIDPADFDRDPMSFVCGNGTIDLRTGELRESKPEDWNTKRSPVAYDPTATAPAWDAFLARVLPDPDVRAFLRRSVGYALTGELREHHFWFLYGRGANGKTTFLEAIRRILGDYAHQAAFETFLLGSPKDGSSASPDLAALRGARLVSATEAPAGRALGEPMLKALTGGDTITARHLYREHIQFKPVCKPWLSGNHKPGIGGDDDGIWRRVLLVPFTEFIPEGERDPELPHKLRAEATGILAWAVAGCLEWQRDGLKPPEAVRRATEGYRAEEDGFARWLGSCVRRADGASMSASDAWSSWQGYAREDGAREHNQRWFKGRMEEAGFARMRRRDGFVYLGAELVQLALPGLS